MLKKLFLSLILTLSCSLFSEEFEEIEFYEDAISFKPFGINGCYLNVQSAASLSDEEHHLEYTQSNAAFAYTHTPSPYYGYMFGLGWVGTEVKMKENPDFNENNFNYISFSFGAFSTSFTDWLWSSNISILIDTQEISLSDYALYQGTLWGKYRVTPCLELDVGFITEIGLKKGKIWPILGFIYNYNPTTRFHLVYPVDIILEKELLKGLTGALSFRFLRNRHRVLADNPLPKAIFEYQATGIEFDLIFAPWTTFSIKGFVGSTLNAHLKLTDENNHSPLYYKFQDSLYTGISGQMSY